MLNMKIKEQQTKEQEQEYQQYIDYEEWLRYHNPPPTNIELNNMEIIQTIKDTTCQDF